MGNALCFLLLSPSFPPFFIRFVYGFEEIFFVAPHTQKGKERREEKREGEGEKWNTQVRFAATSKPACRLSRSAPFLLRHFLSPSSARNGLHHGEKNRHLVRQGWSRQDAQGRRHHGFVCVGVRSKPNEGSVPKFFVSWFEVRSRRFFTIVLRMPLLTAIPLNAVLDLWNVSVQFLLPL